MDKNSFDEVWKFSTGRSIFPQVENGVLPCIKFVLKINSMIINILYEIISMNDIFLVSGMFFSYFNVKTIKTHINI